MRILYIMMCAVALGIMQSGCFVDIVKQEAKESLLAHNQQWYVYKIVLKGGEILTPSAQSSSTMSFEAEENRIFGIASCNNYFATFNLKGKKLKVQDVGSSKRMCESREAGAYEAKFLEHLHGNFEIKKSSQDMELRGKEAIFYLRQIISI